MNECVGNPLETGREIIPWHGSGQIEQHRRGVVRGQLGHPCKDHREDNRRQQGLEEKPERAQHRLLVDRHQISLDKKPEQIPVLPEFPEPQIEKPGFWFHHQIPRLFIALPGGVLCSRPCHASIMPNSPLGASACFPADTSLPACSGWNSKSRFATTLPPLVLLQPAGPSGCNFPLDCCHSPRLFTVKNR